jgi:3' terminal RNA ribose 2'-O-methyltransferase Hen1
VSDAPLAVAAHHSRHEDHIWLFSDDPLRLHARGPGRQVQLHFINTSGFFLHKHPDHVHTREFPFGSATVFYPEPTDQACTAAVLLDVDPVGMVRGRGGKGGAEDQYVNDRPYVASSLLSVVLTRWFNSALSGRCDQKPELPAAELPLEARLAAVPCRGGEVFLRGLFEPLGYQVEAAGHALDDTMPALGPSRLFTVTLRATRRLSDVLTRLYVERVEGLRRVSW